MSQESQKPLIGKVIIITGASSGIGEMLAKYLAAKGAKVILGARRVPRLASIATEINNQGGQAFYIKTDVTLPDDVKRLIGYGLECAGKVDVLINNAGLMSVAPITQLKIDEWSRMIDVNIKGVLYGIAATLPVFESQGFGHFINIASVAGLKVASPGSTVYSGTKFAVRAISDGLRHEVGSFIRTTVISPGAFESEILNGSSHEESKLKITQFYKKIAVNSSAIGEAIYYAISMPSDVDVNEIVIRPTAQEF